MDVENPTQPLQLSTYEIKKVYKINKNKQWKCNEIILKYSRNSLCEILIQYLKVILFKKKSKLKPCQPYEFK